MAVPKSATRQATQIRPSDTYDDARTNGSAMESSVDHIEHDLNNLRTQVANIIRALADDSGKKWYDAVSASTGGGGGSVNLDNVVVDSLTGEIVIDRLTGTIVVGS